MFRMTYFQSLLKPLSIHHFEKHVQASRADKFSKGFRSRHLLLTMIAAQLQRLSSFREIEAAMNTHQGAFYHLGLRDVRRSTLSDALRKRDVSPFKATCEHLMAQAHRQLRRDYKELLYLIDSTNIKLHDEAFSSWTEANKNDRLKGLKLHMMIDSKHSLPVYANIDQANVNDITDAQNITIEPGATYTFDKGYTAYNWWKSIDEKGAYFVTRLKVNAKYRVSETLPVEESSTEILSDQVICLTNKRPGGARINRYAHQPLRLVTVHREGHERPLHIVSNDFKRSALELADIYKKRWGIELFFKWIKQRLKIKKFLGTSENAVRIQLYSALIAYLLIALKHKASGTEESLKSMLFSISSKLFSRLDDERAYQRWRYKQRREQSLLQLNQMVLI